MADNVDLSNLIIFAVIAIVVLIAVILAVRRHNRSVTLQHRFGPEYERELRKSGDRRETEAELSAREQRVDTMELQDLAPGARARYVDEWTTVQEQFVDDPHAALARADAIVGNVMRDRGYPTADFDQRAADLSADHPRVVANFRAAHAVSERSEHGGASTEDVRRAFVAYRSIFDELIGMPPGTAGRERVS